MKNNNRINFECKTEINTSIFHSRFILYVFHVVLWMTGVFNTRSQRSHMIYFPLLLILDRILFSRGTWSLINYVKRLRGQLFNYLSGSDKREPGVKVTFDGIPNAFGSLIEIIRGGGTPDILPFLTTILCSTRALSPRKEISTESITAPGHQGIWLPEFSRYLSSF
jgi:hypothetical protein